MSTVTVTNEKLIAIFSEAKILVQGDDSYVIDFADAEEIHVTNEDTGEEFVLSYDDIDLEHDLVYGLVLLNK
jgi:TfoX/Sxy family transcriptional regulator of competence genes